MTSDFQKSSEETKSAWGSVGAFFGSLFDELKRKAAETATNISNSLANAAANLRAGGHTTLAGAADWLGNNIAWVGGVKYNKHASGTSFAPGGITEINEHGGEIVDLPTGSRVYPHATTMKMLSDAITSPSQSNSNTANITISGNTFTVREEADIDKIAYQILQLVQGAQANYNPI
jgi:phage-related protein